MKLTEHYVREQILQVSAGNYRFRDKYSDLNEVSYNYWKPKDPILPELKSPTV